MYKLLLSVLSVGVLLVQPALAARPAVGAHVGSTTFSDTFESGTTFGGSVLFNSRSGIGLEFRGSYLETELSSTGGTVKMVPVTVGVNFSSRRSSTITPYAGAFTGIRFMSDPYDSSHLIYGGKAGVNFKVGRDALFYVEALKTIGEDDSFKLDIESTSYLAGFTFLLGQPGKKQMDKQHHPMFKSGVKSDEEKAGPPRPKDRKRDPFKKPHKKDKYRPFPF